MTAVALAILLVHEDKGHRDDGEAPRGRDPEDRMKQSHPRFETFKRNQYISPLKPVT